MTPFSQPEALVFFHALAVVLVVLAPLACWVVASRIRVSPSSRARILGYQLAIAALLVSTLAVSLAVPPALFFSLPLQTRGVKWLPSRELISVLAVLLILLTALPFVLARRAGPFQIGLHRQLGRLRALLPTNRSERLWFTAAAVCAGACEEFLYRGFLLHYLHVFPWHINLAASIAISCAVFAVVHLYQGTAGILQTVLLGLGMAVLFIATRSLLLPILLHVVLDLRVLMVPPVPKDLEVTV